MLLNKAICFIVQWCTFRPYLYFFLINSWRRMSLPLETYRLCSNRWLYVFLCLKSCVLSTSNVYVINSGTPYIFELHITINIPIDNISKIVENIKNTGISIYNFEIFVKIINSLNDAACLFLSQHSLTSTTTRLITNTAWYYQDVWTSLFILRQYPLHGRLFLVAHKTLASNWLQTRNSAGIPNPWSTGNDSGIFPPVSRRQVPSHDTMPCIKPQYGKNNSKFIPPEPHSMQVARVGNIVCNNLY